MTITLGAFLLLPLLANRPATCWSACTLNCGLLASLCFELLPALLLAHGSVLLRMQFPVLPKIYGGFN